MPFVGAGFGNHIDRGTGRMTVSRRADARIHFHLHDRFRRRIESDAEEVRIPVLHAIHQEIVIFLPLAENRRHDGLAHRAMIRSSNPPALLELYPERA